ncbi:cryptochrome/photolyase family protein [Robiginitalea sp. IMCC44478]|uniref:cryptochrome/photolyase family protein n=1 Tax=Robiginitalea sp. IMCC44478 TaxID=3459122 RepID=UPI0040426699
MADSHCIFWFRRDLRLTDNKGLETALKSGKPVLPIFIFDKAILEELPEEDARVSFIHKQLCKISESLKNDHKSGLAVFHGEPEAIFKRLISEGTVAAVYTNRDYEPYARKRDQAVEALLKENDIPFHTCKDQVIFEKSEVVKDDGDPYVVYTPYMKKWKEHFEPEKHLQKTDSVSDAGDFLRDRDFPWISLEDMGFKPSEIEVPDYDLSTSLIDNYEDTRNFPAKDGTSHLGPHLRFGTISVRQAAKKALDSENETFLNELIWREFFMQILWHYPETVNNAFKKKYDRIPWRNKEEEFEKWKNGNTGYQLVDAGMRQLNKTGYMHNRVRMLVASFLCKHLLIDWRWGEAYFAEKLLDYEQASNVGNWQWAAGSGVDAAPYFRIFNPMTQVDKFDKGRNYIRQWVEEVDTDSYPDKIVDHKEARERCLETYKEALN